MRFLRPREERRDRWPVRVAPSPRLGPGQLGGFATRSLDAGVVVLEMERPMRISRAQVEQLIARWGLPPDGFPQVTHTRPGYRLDLRLLTGRPPWYRLNHSWRPNTKMCAQGSGVYWVSLRSIKRGEELTYFYGQPDPSWSREI